MYLRTTSLVSVTSFHADDDDDDDNDDARLVFTLIDLHWSTQSAAITISRRSHRREVTEKGEERQYSG